MKNKKQYIAPAVTMVSFTMERGFLFSDPTNRQFDFIQSEMGQDYNSNYDDQCQQTWSSGNNLGESW